MVGEVGMDNSTFPSIRVISKEKMSERPFNLDRMASRSRRVEA